MFRKSIITVTITFAAIAFIAVSSPAPASAHAWDCWIEPTHCFIELGTMVTEGDADEEVGSVTGGGLIIPELTPGGFSSDAPIETVVVPTISEDLLDALTSPTVEVPGTLILPEPVEPPSADDAPDVSDSAPETGETSEESAPANADGPESVAPTTPNAGSPAAGGSESSTPPVALDAPSDSVNSIDPLMAAVFGMIGSLAFMLLVLAASAAGRRRSE